MADHLDDVEPAVLQPRDGDRGGFRRLPLPRARVQEHDHTLGISHAAGL
jgi:hypothetical protein